MSFAHCQSLLLTHGVVRTMDPALPVADAVLIVGNRIAAVGPAAEVRLAAPAGTETLDLGRLLVLPAFTDAHVHLVEFAISLQTIRLDDARSREEVVARVAEAARERPPGEWILGQGWDRNLWPDPSFPHHADLDRVAPDHPVALDSKDLHSLWVNSLALRLAGITAQTPDPPGGEIVRDAHGEPSGILKENPARMLVRRVIPRPGPGQMRRLLQEATRRAWAQGVTAVHVPEDVPAFRLLQDLRREGALGLRVLMHLTEQSVDGAIQAGVQSGFGDDCLRVGGVKVFLDGALGSRTAEMLEPYLTEPGNFGIPVMSDEDLHGLLLAASRAGIAAAIHAIGDRANRRALDALERVRADEAKRDVPRDRLRHRIEHVQLLHPDDLPRLAALDVIASVQPSHAVADMEMAERYWGSERCRLAYAYGSLWRSGARLALGSDCPVEDLNPLAGIHAAVTRRRPDGLPGPEGWNPQERLTVEQAVWGFTMGGAYAAGEEGQRGSITPGKLADLVILSEDIFRAEPDAILGTEVVATILDGQVVYGEERL
ncbi:MAG: amidohydrolase [Anaerolineae bacterium]|nr:amidohydrolase [Anaerolineae bacterium]